MGYPDSSVPPLPVQGIKSLSLTHPDPWLAYLIIRLLTEFVGFGLQLEKQLKALATQYEDQIG